MNVQWTKLFSNERKQKHNDLKLPKTAKNERYQ